jgi:tripeptide aminopeptidase
MDTVPLTAPVRVVERDGRLENDGDGILGADNKAAVAVILEVARRASVEGSPVGLELLFTVSEENALAGAKAFDVSQLEASFGYVFDHATPIGEVVVASPTYYRIGAEFRGAAAHAGIRPEAGRSAILAAAHAIGAMPHGRLDDQTTANVGYVHAGVPAATNVVPEHCSLLAETRSLDAERVETVVARMVDALQDGAAHAECDVDVTVEKLFTGYRLKATEPAVVAAEAALSACGYEPVRITTGGGADANAFVADGLVCVNVANGTERNHQPDERVSVAALEGMLDVALALLDAAAETAQSSGA